MMMMTFESSWSSTIKVGPLLKPTDMPNCCATFTVLIYIGWGWPKWGEGSNIPTYCEKIGKILPTATIFFGFTQNYWKTCTLAKPEYIAQLIWKCCTPNLKHPCISYEHIPWSTKFSKEPLCTTNSAVFPVPTHIARGVAAIDSYSMLMRANEDEVGVHGCLCPGDMDVRMHEGQARQWAGVGVSLASSLTPIKNTRS